MCCIVYSGKVKGEVGMRSRVRCVESTRTHHPPYTTHVRSRTNLTFYLPTIYNTQKSSINAYKVSHYQPEDDHE